MTYDYYNCLEVSRDATEDEIKQQYRKLCKKYHPDANRGDKLSEERLKQINEAYEHLSDKEKRSAYDKKIFFDQIESAQSNVDTPIVVQPIRFPFDPQPLVRAAAVVGIFALAINVLSGRRSKRRRTK